MSKDLIVEKWKIDKKNTVIAGGGITCIEDIKYYQDIGADAYSLGTVCFNLVKLKRILKDAEENIF